MAEEGNNHPQTETTATETAGSGGIIGTVKSYLGLDDKTTASIQDTVASTSAQVTSTVASAADSVLPESIKPEAVKGAAGGATESSTDPPTDPSTDKSETKEAEATEDSAPAAAGNDGNDDEDVGGEKPTTSTDGKPRENPESIPTAGGQKLGEEHWGESKVVPADPKPKEEETETPGVASAAGQPTDEVKANTAQNVGGATGGPPPPASEASNATSPTRSSTDPEKKTKFLDKIKNKLKKDKS